MRFGRQELNVRQLDGRHGPRRPLGRQAPIFKNFLIRHIFLKFCFFKYKNEKGANLVPACMKPLCGLRLLPLPCVPTGWWTWTAAWRFVKSQHRLDRAPRWSNGWVSRLVHKAPHNLHACISDLSIGYSIGWVHQLLKYGKRAVLRRKRYAYSRNCLTGRPC